MVVPESGTSVKVYSLLDTGGWMVKGRMPEPKLRTSDARMVCKTCRRTLDVFWDNGDDSFTGRDPNVSRPVGLVPRHQLLGVIPDDVLGDPALVVYRCHRDCGRLLLLDLYDVWHECARGGQFEV